MNGNGTAWEDLEEIQVSHECDFIYTKILDICPLVKTEGV